MNTLLWCESCRCMADHSTEQCGSVRAADTCENCGRQGHTAVECRRCALCKRRNHATANCWLCTLCHKRGHTAEQCVLCERCGRRGHLPHRCWFCLVCKQYGHRTVQCRLVACAEHAFAHPEHECPNWGFCSFCRTRGKDAAHSWSKCMERWKFRCRSCKRYGHLQTQCAENGIKSKF